MGKISDITRDAPTIEALAHPSLASLQPEYAPALMSLAGRSLSLSGRAQEAEDRIQELERTVTALLRVVILLVDDEIGHRKRKLKRAVAELLPERDDDEWAMSDTVR